MQHNTQSQTRKERIRAHTAQLYEAMDAASAGRLTVGLDEVGRGALAGPLTVACVALPSLPRVIGLDDSKRLSPKRREELSSQIKEIALAFAVAHVASFDIDAYGMSACLRQAFSKALLSATKKLEDKGLPQPECVLIDGLPLHIHKNERSIIKGDAKIACIAAASIVAKVTRDALMVRLSESYGAYDFAKNKGYGSAAHRKAIQKEGPCAVHRLSFLHNIYSDV